MTRFSIQCATCQSKLTVRDPSLLGQILACPKCNSMVLIEAPPDLDLENLEKPKGDIDPSVSNVVQTSDHARRSHDSQADTKPMSVPDPEEFAEPGTELVLPNSDWSSSESQKIRKILLLGGMAVVGVVLAVAVAGFWFGRSRNSEGTQGDPEIASADSPPVAKDAPPNEIDPDSPEAKRTDLSSNANDVTTSEQTNQNPATLDSTPENPTNKDPANKDPANVGPISQPPDTEDRNPKEDSPPGFDTETPGDPQAESRLAESLKRLESLLSPGSEEEESRPRVSPIDLLKPRIELADKPTPRKIDLNVQLQRRIPQVEFGDTPLLDWLRFLSEMTTIPITLDPRSAHFAGIRPKTPVSASLEDKTVNEILGETLTPLGLAYRATENGIRIIPAGSAEDLVTLDVADLVADNPRGLEQLASWVTSLVSPADWTVSGGLGNVSVQGSSLLVQNEPLVVFQVRQFLDRLRQARGLTPQYGLSGPAMEMGLPACEGLTRAVRCEFRIPTYFTKILTELSEQADVDILVDWDAAQSVGWNHEGQLRLRAADEPLHAVLDRLLASMELTFVVVDSATIQVTSRSAARESLRTVFHDADAAFEALDNDPDALITLCESTLGVAKFRPQGPVSIAVDPASRQLIASGPEKLQRAIATLLENVASAP